MQHNNASRSLADLTGTEPHVLYQVGQNVAALQSHLSRQPSLRIVLLRMTPPMVMAIHGQRLMRPSSPLRLDSDMGHRSHLNTLMHGELGVHSVSPASILQAGKVFEIRGADLERISEATRAVAAARDMELQTDGVKRRGIFARLKPAVGSRKPGVQSAMTGLLEVISEARGHQLDPDHFSASAEQIKWEDV